MCRGWRAFSAFDSACFSLHRMSRLRTSGSPQITPFLAEEIAMQHLAQVTALFVAPTITGKEATQLILRWFHFIAGITWIGLLYFFNIVNVPFMKQVDAAAKPKIFQNLTLPALNWFRWSALLTVFFGFWYWGQFYVGPDAQREGKSAGATIGFFLLLWIVVWAILFFVIKKV